MTWFSAKLRLMAGKSRLIMSVGLLVIMLALVFLQAGKAKSSGPLSSLFSENKQVAGEILVEIHFTPEAVGPGEPINLSITLTNNGAEVTAPELIVQMDDAISIDLNDLPAGTFYNAQKNEISWQPIVPGAGSQVFLVIPFLAGVADIQMPEQTIIAILHSNGTEQLITANYWVGLRPTANLSFDPPQAAVGQPVRLIGDISGPGPITQIWSLGDGRIIEVNDPEVVYSNPGTYNVILQASNPLGSTTNGGQLTVVAQPIARFSLSDPTPMANDPITFTDESGGQPPMIYLWDFGDGVTSSEKNPIHSYSNPGTYQAHLIIQNDVGSSEAFLPINVGLPPTADVIIDGIVDAGKPINGQAFFDDTTSNIHWDMGDGASYDGDQITHVYWSAGNYQISVTASNEFGDTVLQRRVDVNPGILHLYLPSIFSGIDSSLPAEVTGDLNVEMEIAAETVIAIESLELPEDLNPAEQLFNYINEARRLSNLPPLTQIPELSNAAQSHTNDMASNGITGHEGSDGSSPPLRIQLSGYPGGYGGEATAWGMQNASEPVQYWLSSPAHRAIILNPLATDVGVAFSENYRAPNVWYWTAEFGSLDLPKVNVTLPPSDNPVTTDPAPTPEIQLLGPPQNSEFTLSSDTNLIFTWSWPEPLQAEQQFSIYMQASGRTFKIGTIRESQPTNQYQFKVPSSNVPVTPGSHSWLVRLESNDQSGVIFESTRWPIVFREPSALPTDQSETTDQSTEIDPSTNPTPQSRSR